MGRCEQDKRRKCDFDPDELDYCDSLQTIESGEVCGAASIYGNRYIEITSKQIEDLRAGKVLCYVDEYGMFIKLRKDSDG